MRDKRIIKYRFWDGEKMYDWSWALEYQIEHVFNPDVEVWEVMSYTGLKDKAGKEIWEGDVLMVFDEAVVPVTDEGQGPIEECNHFVVVEMRNGVWGFEIPKTDDGETGWYGLHYWITDMSNEGYQVVGDVYQNPELVTESEARTAQ